MIQHFTHYEWPFEIFTKIFGLLKINEPTGSDKDEEVQRRTVEVYSENLHNKKLYHSSSMRVPASLLNQGRKKKVSVYSKRQRVNHHFYITGSVHKTQKKSENEKNPRKR